MMHRPPCTDVLYNIIQNKTLFMPLFNFTRPVSDYTRYEIPTVVFNAHSVTTYSPPKGQPVVFSSVISNIGHGYNSTTGKFTAPVNGTYSFTAQLCTYYGKTGYFSLVLDGSRVTVVANYDHDYTTTVSTTVPLFLEQGQKVWIQTAYSCSSCLHNYSSCWNQFSGSLVHR